jgi:uncharacterized repeat protein (TIGR03803 family)
LPSGGIVLDDAGNLYGATTAGGFDNSCIYQGCGTIFELSPTNGSWTEKLLYRFTGGADGAVPGYYPANVAGTNLALYGGNIYGTASYGGNQMGLSGAGVVYELSPSGDAWKQTVLHTFASSPDGKVPQSGVVADVDGNLYGTTVQGGDSDNGTVYKITPVRAAKE